MSDNVKNDRRNFLGVAALGVTAARLGILGSARVQPGTVERTDAAADVTWSNKSFDALKHIDAGVLNVGYAEAGPSNGHPVILLHGWPYDIYSYVDVTPILAAKGYRVIVPFLRGYGSTRFLSNATPRNGQQSVVAIDIIALMDALKIEKAIVGGFDWGARTANILA